MKPFRNCTRALTQVQLARTPGIRQATVAQMEKRSDLMISTLCSHIGAMGGRLKMTVEFPDRAPTQVAGLGTHRRKRPKDTERLKDVPAGRQRVSRALIRALPKVWAGQALTRPADRPVLLMDRAYEDDATRQLIRERRFRPVVPPKRNRCAPWQYDRQLYRRRNEIERLFRRFRGFRRIFSRFTGPMSCSSASSPSNSSSNSCV